LICARKQRVISGLVACNIPRRLQTLLKVVLSQAIRKIVDYGNLLVVTTAVESRRLEAERRCLRKDATLFPRDSLCLVHQPFAVTQRAILVNPQILDEEAIERYVASHSTANSAILVLDDQLYILVAGKIDHPVGCDGVIGYQSSANNAVVFI
jgi:hypothetical protein